MPSLKSKTKLTVNCFKSHSDNYKTLKYVHFYEMCNSTYYRIKFNLDFKLD